MLTVSVLSYALLFARLMKNELWATFGTASGATWSTQATYWPKSEVDPGKEVLG